ncbi:hypothetical protein LL072_13345 [Lactobacillus delbrueckii subsp. lactis DSM 20072]|nr:hypothetical protein LL072_13345 [Lactobacillus delbrueckii subsp. lactis DSM 20072]
MNHKQLVYHFLFRKRAARTVDALIMPEEGGTRTEKYVDLNNDWLPKTDQNIAILLTHLNAKDVIQCFFNTKFPYIPKNELRDATRFHIY